MKEKRFTKKQMVCAILLTAALSLGGVLLLAVALLGPQGLSVLEGYVLIKTIFVGEADMDQVADQALYAMAEATGDRWTYYLDPAWNESQLQAEANQSRGIGVTVLYREEGLLVTDVVPGGGAAEAGILAGETLREVNGLPLYGENVDENRLSIQGEDGTFAKLLVRDAQGTERMVEAERRSFFNSPVRYEMLEGKVGYIRLRDFHSGAARELAAAVDDLTAQGAGALLFDMRQNGGGFLDELCDILDKLLPEGPIFYQQTSWGWSWTKQSDAAWVDLPMAVLVDQDSYSAAELFAGQLRESVNAPIVGVHTSGKGYFQYHFGLPHGGGLGLSIGKYATGGKVSLAGVGLTPDKEIALTQEQTALLRAYWLPKEEDPQLQTGVELLKKLMETS